MKRNIGQIFIEFVLVFTVLLAVTAGIFLLYKSAWKNKYSSVNHVTAVGILLNKGYVK